MNDAARQRYTAVAIALHWLIALGILAQIAIGLVMSEMKISRGTLFYLFQLHKSVGITIMLVVVLRILWRFTHKPPELPDEMPPLERQAALGAHVALYVLMIGLPLTGWAAVSASPFNIPTVLFGLVPWPHLPYFSTLPDKKAAEEVLGSIHSWGAWILIAVLVLHIGAALRHHFVKRDTILLRMLPYRRF